MFYLQMESRKSLSSFIFTQIQSVIDINHSYNLHDFFLFVSSHRNFIINVELIIQQISHHMSSINNSFFFIFFFLIIHFVWSSSLNMFFACQLLCSNGSHVICQCPFFNPFMHYILYIDVKNRLIFISSYWILFYRHQELKMI